MAVSCKCLEVLEVYCVWERGREFFYWIFLFTMAGLSQDGNDSGTQQWSQNSPWISWSQPQFGLHEPSLRSRNFNNFQLFNDEDVDFIGTQMPQHVEGNRDMSMRGKI